MRKFIVFAALMFFFQFVGAQVTKSTDHYEQVWFGYFNQSRISKRWGFWFDGHLRTKDNFFDSLSIAMVRPGITYYLSDKIKFTVGYTYNNIYPADNHSGISQPDHRIWEQIQWHTNYSRIRLMQWIRLEQRWRRKIAGPDELAEGYSYNNRLRYNFFFQVPITKKAYEKGAVTFVVNDEVMVNFGKQVVYNYFDQNRFFVGFNYFLNAHSNIQFGYLNVFQQLAAGNKYKSTDAARLFFFQNLDFRRK